MKRDPDAPNVSTASTETDAELLSQLARGEESAMAHLFARYSRLVYSVALRVLHEPSSAEDVLQEIFMQVWRNPASFVAARGSLGGWLAVVARNRSIDLLRKRRPTDSVDDLPLASPHDVTATAERNVMLERVRGAMEHLPKEQKRSLELAFFEGCSHSEIATMTGDPLGTVKTRIRSALLTLERAFQS